MGGGQHGRPDHGQGPARVVEEPAEPRSRTEERCLLGAVALSCGALLADGGLGTGAARGGGEARGGVASVTAGVLRSCPVWSRRSGGRAADGCADTPGSASHGSWARAPAGRSTPRGRPAGAGSRRSALTGGADVSPEVRMPRASSSGACLRTTCRGRRMRKSTSVPDVRGSDLRAAQRPLPSLAQAAFRASRGPSRPGRPSPPPGRCDTCGITTSRSPSNTPDGLPPSGGRDRSPAGPGRARRTARRGP